MIIRRLKIRVPPNRQIRFTLFPSFLSKSVNRPYFSRRMGLCVWDIDNSIRTALFSARQGHGLGAQNPANLVTPFPVHQVPESFRPAAQISPGPPSDERRKAIRKDHRPSRIAFLHLNSKAERAERRPALRSALHIIIPKGEVMRGGPRALLLIISKEKN